MVEMRRPRLETVGLSEVVSQYVTQYTERTAIQVTLDLAGLTDDELDFSQQLAVFRVLQEAMRNASRHAGASEVLVRALREPSTLKVRVEDNGQGFNLLGVTASYPRRGLGLAGMQERAKAVGGQVEIDSRPGRGTRITLVIPVYACGDGGKAGKQP
jgi:signal transduction histidine kinase